MNLGQLDMSLAFSFIISLLRFDYFFYDNFISVVYAYDMQNKRTSIDGRILSSIFIVTIFLLIIGLVWHYLSVQNIIHFGDSASSLHGDSFHPNAWKFADLIEPHIPYVVDHVVDGDTLVVVVAGNMVTLRLIGIDTPETVDPRKPVGCYGPEASAEAKRVFSSSLNSNFEAASTSSGTQDRSVFLERDPLVGDYDKYGRVLVYAMMPIGTGAQASSTDNTTLTYNEYMIRNGYAREYTYMNQSYAFQQAFKYAEKQARGEHVGLWDVHVCPR